jgi:hypothetical protein
VTDVTTGENQDEAQLSATDEQVLRDRARAGGRAAGQAHQDGGRGRAGG